jgi:hypothetical protein
MLLVIRSDPIIAKEDLRGFQCLEIFHEYYCFVKL